jgi:hypothetical protein
MATGFTASAELTHTHCADQVGDKLHDTIVSSERL